MAQNAYRYDYPAYGGTAAPKRSQPAPSEQRRPERPPLKRVPGSAQRTRRERAAARRMLAASMAAFGVFILAITLVIYTTASVRSARNDLNDIQDEMFIYNQQYAQVSQNLNKLASVDKIDEIAKKLGMVKCDSSNIIYIDADGENRILYSSSTE